MKIKTLNIEKFLINDLKCFLLAAIQKFPQRSHQCAIQTVNKNIHDQKYYMYIYIHIYIVCVN